VCLIVICGMVHPRRPHRTVYETAVGPAIPLETLALAHRLLTASMAITKVRTWRCSGTHEQRQHHQNPHTSGTYQCAHISSLVVSTDTKYHLCLTNKSQILRYKEPTASRYLTCVHTRLKTGSASRCARCGSAQPTTESRACSFDDLMLACGAPPFNPSH